LNSSKKQGVNLVYAILFIAVHGVKSWCS